MAIDSDVLVIGGGLAGMTAALVAADDGASVRLVSAGASTLRQASGLVDLLGYVPEPAPSAETAVDGPSPSGGRFDALSTEPNRPVAPVAGPLANPFDALDSLPARHPYRLVGTTTIRRAFDRFDDAVGDLYRGGNTDRNALVATVGGTVKPTARYPTSVAPGLASADRATMLVGFSRSTAFDAKLAADHLAAAGVPFPVTGVTVSFGTSFRDDARRTRLARALEANERLRDGVRAREALAAAIARHIESESNAATAATGERSPERVGLPAVLGIDRHETVRRDLEDRLGIAVFEVPTGPPSLPGQRLERRLRAALDVADVTVETGVSVVGCELEAVDRRRSERTPPQTDHVACVLVDRTGSEVPYSAGSFVLATGGFVGTGLESNRERISEPVFGCHVPQPSDRTGWYGNALFGEQPFARIGVTTDARLRPLDEDGETQFENVFAAGETLAGADVAREQSASGVSLSTGYVAGREAAREARE